MGIPTREEVNDWQAMMGEDPGAIALAADKANDESLVEDLLHKRIHNGTTQYLISWQGDWTGPFDSLTGKEKWENEADIEDSLIHQECFSL
jgi:hypothetical protein